MLHSTSRAGEAVFSFIAPEPCILCGQGRVHVCPTCRSRLGAPAVWGSVAGVPLCTSSGPEQDVVMVLRQVKDNLQTSLTGLLASVIAAPLAAAVERYERIDAFIVVPTSWKSWRLRGFHPMKLILRMLNIRSTVVIRRRRRAHDQRGLTVDERIANLTGAFEGSPRCRGKHFMLIDDVVTSGATVAEVIRAVRVAGGEVVCVVALAHVALRRHAEKY